VRVKLNPPVNRRVAGSNPARGANFRAVRERGTSSWMSGFEPLAFRSAFSARSQLALSEVEAPRSQSQKRSIPETWVTPYSGDMGSSFGPKGMLIGSSRHVSSSKTPGHSP